MVIWKSIVIWFVMMAAETLHGMARNLWLAPHIGDFPARQVSFLTGSILMVTIATLFVGWLKPSRTQLLQVGLLWASLTLLFEIVLGRWILKYSWDRILADYNLSHGGLMAFGLVLLMLLPFIAVKIQEGLRGRNRHT